MNMTETSSYIALRTYLKEESSKNRLVVENNTLLFRPLTFSESLLMLFGAGNSSFKKCILFISEHPHLLQDDESVIKLIHKVLQFNHFRAPWNRISRALLNKLRPFPALEKTIVTKDISSLSQLLSHGISLTTRNHLRQTILHRTCIYNDTEMTLFLLKKQANPNVIDTYGHTPLQIACEQGNKTLVHELLLHGADINLQDRRGRSPLLIACERKDLELTELLLQAHADVNCLGLFGITPLHLATANNQQEMVQLLLNYGAYINAQDVLGETVLHQACTSGNKEIIELLLTHGAHKQLNQPSQTPYYCACERSPQEISDLLATTPQNQNTCPCSSKAEALQKIFRPEPCLHCACAHGDKKLIEELLSQGISINAKNIHGETVLHAACEMNRLDVVELLLGKGADANIFDRFGQTILMQAFDNRNRALLKLLLEKAIHLNVNATDVSGRTLLHKACELGDKELVEMVLARNADVNQITYFDQTALHFARQGGFQEIINLLIAHGADL